MFNFRFVSTQFSKYIIKGLVYWYANVLGHVYVYVYVT